MDISTQTAAERIARVLAGQRISVNAEGDEESASREVDDVWKDYLADAAAVLRTLREPDAAMAEAGNAAVWEKMILVAIDQTRPEKVVL
jgi:hypothetical protein